MEFSGRGSKSHSGQLSMATSKNPSVENTIYISIYINIYIYIYIYKYIYIYIIYIYYIYYILYIYIFAFLRFDILSSSKILSFTLNLQFSKTLFTNFGSLITWQCFLKLFKCINNYLNMKIGQALKRSSQPEVFP